MIFINEVLVQALIFLLGVCGFFVASHIYKHKRSKQPLICPVGFDCNFVVHSNYSEFIHIPLEIFGMIYYAVLSIFYLFLLLVESGLSPMIYSFLILASFGASIFSLYLIGVQIFVLKKGCSWCIVSAIISISIFVLSISMNNFSFILQFFTK